MSILDAYAQVMRAIHREVCLRENWPDDVATSISLNAWIEGYGGSWITVIRQPERDVAYVHESAFADHPRELRDALGNQALSSRLRRALNKSTFSYTLISDDDLIRLALSDDPNATIEVQQGQFFSVPTRRTLTRSEVCEILEQSRV